MGHTKIVAVENVSTREAEPAAEPEIEMRIKNTIRRARLLATGRTEWVDEETGEVEVRHEPWATRWAIVGVHSNRWHWVNKWGKEECGCIINPLTRRRVLYRWGCERHCPYSREDTPEEQ